MIKKCDLTSVLTRTFEKQGQIFINVFGLWHYEKYFILFTQNGTSLMFVITTYSKKFREKENTRKIKKINLTFFLIGNRLFKKIPINLHGRFFCLVLKGLKEYYFWKMISLFKIYFHFYGADLKKLKKILYFVCRSLN